MSIQRFDKKIGIVTPWFGFHMPGGAEAEISGLALHLHDAGVEVEVLTTCVKDFTRDWSENYHTPGVVKEKGITVRRFRAKKRDNQAFDNVNIKLMNNQIPLTPEEEQTYVREMVNSPDLYEYMEKNQNEYVLFIFIPYMFGTTYYGAQIVPEKSVLIPCFHEESYLYMKVFKEAYSKVAGFIFHAKPEMELAKRVFDLPDSKCALLGEGVNTDIQTFPDQFRKKFGITKPFILYAGRKDAGKNVDVLLKYFNEYKLRNENDLQLVLIGGGQIDIPEDCEDDVMDLGFVDVQDKYNAYGAATMLCQPSTHESFSLVVMESWLCHRPVLVADACDVTKNFCNESNGGLYFANYAEFEETVNYFIENPKLTEQMGENGRNYVLSHFAWDVIVKVYTEYFKRIIEK